ncbi:MAG TPA: PEP-CTERM sorting domain-containing protein [Myxococcota bacterium]|nr:PEP-CTERM sorting domain-containing protein [Myxococcota bacterium]
MSGSNRELRGGGFDNEANSLAASNPIYVLPSDGVGAFIGFRVASLVPEPGTGLLVMVGVLGLAVTRRRAGVSA